MGSSQRHISFLCLPTDMDAHPLGFMMLLSMSTSTMVGGQWRRGEMRHSQPRGHCVSLDHFIFMNLSHTLCKHY